MDDDIIFFDGAIHINHFLLDQIQVGEDEETGEPIMKPLDLTSEEFLDWSEGLHISLEGTVIGIDASLVRPYIKDPMVRGIRYGTKKMPKQFKITNKDEFYKLFAIYTPLEDML